MAVILSVDGTVTDIKNTELKYLQNIVGGYIEIIPLQGTDQLLVINEEGKLKDLPVNEIATKMLRACYPPVRDFIVGNAVLCKNTEID